MRNYHLATALILLLLLPFTLLATNCEEIRVALDIGSGATKMVVAKVNNCLNKRGEILLEKNIPIPFKSNLDNSKDQSFDQNIQNFALEQIGKLKEEASSMAPKKFVAVATSSFRNAKNGEEFGKRIERVLGIRFHVIDQRTEAILGHLAVTQGREQQDQDILVWDIGGGSMQMTYLDKSQNYTIYEGKLASVSFKNMIITAIQGKDYTISSTPNPLGAIAAKKALNLAQYYAKTHIPLEVKEAAKRSTIVGIGSLHNYSILKKIPNAKNSYQQSDLLKALSKKKDFNDTQLAGDYAETDVSNLALVGGFMKELGIDKVEVQDVNMAHGILTFANYWE